VRGWVEGVGGWRGWWLVAGCGRELAAEVQQVLLRAWEFDSATATGPQSKARHGGLRGTLTHPCSDRQGMVGRFCDASFTWPPSSTCISTITAAWVSTQGAATMPNS